ncbi:hypothetical protein ACHAQA_003307 [Verticillium albo-atrum]
MPFETDMPVIDTSLDEYPSRADFRQMLVDRPLPTIAPGIVDPNSMAGDEPAKQASIVLGMFNAAMARADADALADCFLAGQAYWRDILAMTYHLRTFFGPKVISQSLLKTSEFRRISEGFKLDSAAVAISVATRLKALGVDSVMVERNANVGDNWALRYDSLRFHLPTSFCDLPFMAYDDELRTPHLLSRDELAAQVRRFVAAFNLNVITSAKIRSTHFDPSSKQWQVTFDTPDGPRTVIAKHLVQATGFGSQKPYLPEVADRQLYKGISIHSVQYKNAQTLKDQGVKSVLIVGSANTAFDVLEDIHAASLTPTILARSPTCIIPLSYLCSPRALGAFDADVPAADRRSLTLPACIDAQFIHALFAHMAAQEPGRYAALEGAGFPVADSRDLGQALAIYLVERSGGHYFDIGGTEIIARREVGVVSGVEVEGYTASGVRLSDGRVVEADAVIWCTGFADRNVRDTAAEILGGQDVEVPEGMLGPREIAARLDATLGVDAEGETRGMWKRHLRMDNYWAMGGDTQKHRWHSRTLALQIKAALEGALPTAYRETPVL